MALLQVQVLQTVSEEVEVGGGRVEIIIDRDTETAQVSLTVRGRKILQLPIRDFSQGLGDTQGILTGAAAVVLTADRPDDGNHDEESQEDRLYEHQLPGGVDMLHLALLVLFVLVNDLPEKTEVERPSLLVHDLTV